MATWTENLHPRGEGGRFTAGGGGGGGGSGGWALDAHDIAEVNSFKNVSDHAKLAKDSLSRGHTLDETAAVRSYTNTEIDWQKINRRTRRGASVPSKYNKVINDLGSAIAASTLSENVVVYRGVSKQFADKLKALEPGQSLVDKGFASGSTEPKNADVSGQGLLMKILAPAGATALPLDNAQQEVIFPKDSKLEFVGEDPKDGTHVFRYGEKVAVDTPAPKEGPPAGAPDGSRPTDLPMSKKYSQEKGNLDNLVSAVEKAQADGTLTEKSVKLADLRATQNYLGGEGAGEAVFEDLTDKPVVVNDGTEQIILDGHHRISDAIKAGETTIDAHYVSLASKKEVPPPSPPPPPPKPVPVPPQEQKAPSAPTPSTTTVKDGIGRRPSEFAGQADLTWKDNSADWKNLKDANDAFFGKHYVSFASDGAPADVAVERARTIDKTLTDMYTQLPGLTRKHDAGFSDQVRLAQLFAFTVQSGKAIEGHASAVGIYGEVSQAIAVSSKLKQQQGSLAKKGGEWSTTTQTLQGVVRHEYGHAVQARFEGAVKANKGFGMFPVNAFGQTVLDGQVFSVVSLFRKANGGAIGGADKKHGSMAAKALSIYGATNSKEWFAESFAAYAHPDYGKPGTLRIDPTLEKLFDKVFK